MQIKRDYSKPFFSKGHRRGGSGRFFLSYVLFLGTFVMFVYMQFDSLQLAALDAVGAAPTATPYASEVAGEGYNYFLAGDLDGAAEMYRQAVQQQPNNVGYLYEYGRTLIELDRAEEALTYGDRAIEANPNDARGYALKAKALVWLGRPAEAVPVGVSGLEVNPNFAPIYAALARAYTNVGRYQEGLRNGETAIEMDPMDADAHRSYAYALMFVGDRISAIDQLEQAIAINPNLTDTYFELAVNYLSLDRDALAIATYERVLSLEPRNARAYLRLCESYFKVGQNQQAENYCSDALNIDPTYPQAWRQIGMVQYNRRNYEGAINSFEACVENGGDEIQCWYLRGLAHYYLNECDTAWTVLTDSLARANTLVDPGPVADAIREGLRLTTVSCAGYSGRALPTDIPPTPIPPTPIGGI